MRSGLTSAVALLTLFVFASAENSTGQSSSNHTATQTDQHLNESTRFRVTTWNLEWFPSGSPNDATLEDQTRSINSAAGILRTLNPDIILLQEVRDYDACAHLGEAISAGTYSVAICSAFKEPFQSGFGRQQVAILAKHLAQAAWAEPWKSMDGVDPPRGFAFAWFKLGGADLGVYSVHLKSNLITHGNRELELAKNIRKREVATSQLVTHFHNVIGSTIPTIKAVLIGGDFNTNHDQTMFAEERTLTTLIDSDFQDCFKGLPLARRITHPANHGYPGATFDYLFGKNLRGQNPVITQTSVSDHWPVTVDFVIR